METTVKESPMYQVFRHNMALLTNALDKNEVSLQNLKDVQIAYNDAVRRIESDLPKHAVQDMIEEFLQDNSFFFEEIERKEQDEFLVIKLVVDGLLETNFIYNTQSTEHWLSSSIKLYCEKEDVSINTSITLLNSFVSIYNGYLYA